MSANYTIDTYTQDEAFEKAEVVLVGEVIKLGVPEPEGVGIVYFYRTEVDIYNYEKGKLKENPTYISYEVFSAKNMQLIPMPEVGKQYRFYLEIKESGKTIEALKITDV